MALIEAIEESVIESIFERGWVEQSPKQFIFQCKHFLRNELKDYQPNCTEETLDKMIINCLMRHLGEEFDVNVYRLKFFPTESTQEYDI